MQKCVFFFFFFSHCLHAKISALWNDCEVFSFVFFSFFIRTNFLVEMPLQCFIITILFSLTVLIDAGLLVCGVSLSKWVYSFDFELQLKALLHGHSYSAHAMGCAAAVKSMKWFKDPRTNLNINSEGKLLREVFEFTFSYCFCTSCIFILLASMCCNCDGRPYSAFNF